MLVNGFAILDDNGLKLQDHFGNEIGLKKKSKRIIMDILEEAMRLSSEELNTLIKET